MANPVGNLTFLVELCELTLVGNERKGFTNISSNARLQMCMNDTRSVNLVTKVLHVKALWKVCKEARLLPSWRTSGGSPSVNYIELSLFV